MSLDSTRFGSGRHCLEHYAPWRLLTGHQGAFFFRPQRRQDLRSTIHAFSGGWKFAPYRYSYTLEYRKSNANGNAGFPASLPLLATESDRTGRRRLTASDNDFNFLVKPHSLLLGGLPAACVSAWVGLLPQTRVLAWVGFRSPHTTFAFFANSGPERALTTSTHLLHNLLPVPRWRSHHEGPAVFSLPPRGTAINSSPPCLQYPIALSPTPAGGAGPGQTTVYPSLHSHCVMVFRSPPPTQRRRELSLPPPCREKTQLGI